MYIHTYFACHEQNNTDKNRVNFFAFQSKNLNSQFSTQLFNRFAILKSEKQIK